MNTLETDSKTSGLADTEVSLDTKNDIYGVLPIINDMGKVVENSAGQPVGSTNFRKLDTYPLTDRGGLKEKIPNFGGFLAVPDDWEQKSPKMVGEASVGLHWLSLTLFCKKRDAFKLYMDLFYDTFGEMVDLGFGLKGYRSVMGASHGFKIGYDPVARSLEHGEDYVSFFIPGEACEALEPKCLREIYKECFLRGIKIRCTRVDYKFDYCNFSPYQFRWMIGNVLVFRHFGDGMVRHIQNDEIDEIGMFGKMTVYTGSNKSERLICCYDEHGFTRLEMRNKGDRAEGLVRWFIGYEVETWPEIMLSHLQDYIYFNHTLWDDFVCGTERAYMKIENKVVTELEKMKDYLINQCSSQASIVWDIDRDWFMRMIEKGRERRIENSRYDGILHRYGLNE